MSRQKPLGKRILYVYMYAYMYIRMYVYVCVCVDFLLNDFPFYFHFPNHFKTGQEGP